MKNRFAMMLRSRIGFRLMMLVAMVSMVGAITSLSAGPASTTTITITNNSSREIRRLYLSPANSNNWGPDQLNESSISPGVTRTLNVTWEQPTVKIVAEDQEGCFLYTTVDATSTIQWTISNDAVPDCG